MTIDPELDTVKTPVKTPVGRLDHILSTWLVRGNIHAMKLFRLCVEALRRDVTGDTVLDGDDNPDMARIKRRLTVQFRWRRVVAGVGMVIADDLFRTISQLAH